MKRNMGNRGFVMVEAMVIVMLFTLLASALYGLAGMKHRMAIHRMQEDEAYYAAVSAVRLMAAELADGENEEQISNGFEPFHTVITFEPDDFETEVISVPVEIWAERNGDELLLEAKAKCESVEKQVMLILYLEEMEIEITEKPEAAVETATSSNPSFEYKSRWIPIYYQVKE